MTARLLYSSRNMLLRKKFLRFIGLSTYLCCSGVLSRPLEFQRKKILFHSWVFLFIFTSSRNLFGGWPCFVASLVFIGILTALVEQVRCAYMANLCVCCFVRVHVCVYPFMSMPYLSQVFGENSHCSLCHFLFSLSLSLSFSLSFSRILIKDSLTSMRCTPFSCCFLRHQQINLSHLSSWLPLYFTALSLSVSLSLSLSLSLLCPACQSSRLCRQSEDQCHRYHSDRPWYQFTRHLRKSSRSPAGQTRRCCNRKCHRSVLGYFSFFLLIFFFFMWELRGLIIFNVDDFVCVTLLCFTHKISPDVLSFFFYLFCVCVYTFCAFPNEDTWRCEWQREVWKMRVLRSLSPFSFAKSLKSYFSSRFRLCMTSVQKTLPTVSKHLKGKLHSKIISSDMIEFFP